MGLHVKWTQLEYRKIYRDDPLSNSGLTLYQARRIAEMLTMEAKKGEKARWQWRGFWLENEEVDQIVQLATKSYIEGSDSARDIVP